jgi:hypothetical protein
MTPTPLFSGEVQFRRYSDTSTQGQQIVLTLADREALSVFIGKEGKRFACVLVEIGDDEMPVEPARKDTRGPLCREACDYCAMPEFQRWALERAGLVGESNANLARDVILQICQIESRKDLDTLPYAENLFRTEIRVPFIRWQRKQRNAA